MVVIINKNLSREIPINWISTDVSSCNINKTWYRLICSTAQKINNPYQYHIMDIIIVKQKQIKSIHDENRPLIESEKLLMRSSKFCLKLTFYGTIVGVRWASILLKKTISFRNRHYFKIYRHSIDFITAFLARNW